MRLTIRGYSPAPYMHQGIGAGVTSLVFPAAYAQQ